MGKQKYKKQYWNGLWWFSGGRSIDFRSLSQAFIYTFRMTIEQGPFQIVVRMFVYGRGRVD